MTKAEKKICIKECKLIQIKLFAADSIVQGRFEFLNKQSLLYLAMNIRPTFANISKWSHFKL